MPSLYEHTDFEKKIKHLLGGKPYRTDSHPKIIPFIVKLLVEHSGQSMTDLYWWWNDSLLPMMKQNVDAFEMTFV